MKSHFSRILLFKTEDILMLTCSPHHNKACHLYSDKALMFFLFLATQVILWALATIWQENSAGAQVLKSGCLVQFWFYHLTAV